MKKILAVLLAVVMAVGMLPAIVLAANPIEIDASYFAEDDEHNPIQDGTMGGGVDYLLREGQNAVIEEDQTWTVEKGTTLHVYGKLEVKGTLIVNGYITGYGDVDTGKGVVIVRCWNEGGEYKHGTVKNAKNICGSETEEVKRYFAEVYVPQAGRYNGFDDPGHLLSVKYLTSRTGSDSDYLLSDLYIENLAFMHEEDIVDTPRWYFEDLYTSANYNTTTKMLKVPLNQYLFLHFDFLNNGAISKEYDGGRMAIKFNNVVCYSKQGVCSQKITSTGVIDFCLGDNTAMSPNASWSEMEPYLLRQERIFIPSGEGYTAYGTNGEASTTDQTVRLNYGQEFTFRVKIDSKFSESPYAVYLVKGYQWDSRNHSDSMEALLDEIYIDEQGNAQHFVWKFEEFKDGESQKAYVDQYGIYHIPSVDDEYTIVVTGLVSNDTLSVAGNLMDTIRNLLNAIKQFFDRVKQMLGL